MAQYTVRGTTVADNPARLDLTSPGVVSQMSPYGKAAAAATMPHSADIARQAGAYTSVPKAAKPQAAKPQAAKPPAVKAVKPATHRVVASSIKAFKALTSKSK